LSGDEDLHSLLLRQAFPVGQELFHAAPVMRLQVIFKGLPHAKLFIRKSQKTQVDHREEVRGRLLPARMRRLQHNDKILFSARPQLDRDSLGRFAAVGILDPPTFRLGLAVDDEVAGALFD
jgi:hypothetical protein